jgi:hypothetical protein
VRNLHLGLSTPYRVRCTPYEPIRQLLQHSKNVVPARAPTTAFDPNTTQLNPLHREICLDFGILGARLVSPQAVHEKS